MVPARLSRSAVVALLAVAVVGPGCAKRDLPSGGPPDIEPPRLVHSFPDSGASRVPLDVRPVLTFSEGMEPRSTNDAISIAPPIEIRQHRWSGRSVTLALGEPLKPAHTYTLAVTATARDRHGNAYGTGATVVFSTSDSFPPGALEGRLDAKGFEAAGSALWCYAHGREPDSTARDFDALGLCDQEGHFRISGLQVPKTYRIWIFVDLNRNRSFEPTTDILAAVDTTFALEPEHPRARDLLLHVTNPRAPGTVTGTVLDSVPDSSGTRYVVAVSRRDSTTQIVLEVTHEGSFEFRLDPGRWTLRAFRDLDGNRTWQPATERASAPFEVTVEPAALVSSVALTLRPRPGGP